MFINELTDLLNRTCQENASNTPDFILAWYLKKCLSAYEEAVIQRDDWYGVNLEPGNKYFKDQAK